MASIVSWGPARVRTPRIPTFAVAVLGAVIGAIVVVKLSYAWFGHLAQVIAGAMDGDGGSAVLLFLVLMGVVALVSWTALGPEDPNSWRVRAAVPAAARLRDMVPTTERSNEFLDTEVGDGAPREIYSPPPATHIPIPARLPHDAAESAAASGVPALSGAALLVADAHGIPAMAFPEGGGA